MIPAAEIQRIAGAAGVEPTRVDLDYTLGWILCGLWAQPEVAMNWVFKGGTCLRVMKPVPADLQRMLGGTGGAGPSPGRLEAARRGHGVRVIG